MTGKEQCFCIEFLETGNAEEAARLAGYVKQPLQTANKLLRNERIICELERLASQKKRLSDALAVSGYYRLAFGSVADAVSLLYIDKPSKEQLSEMNLFMVSEIKKPKNEAMEIKFFDRMKALEKLALRECDKDETKSLFDAISNSARTVAGVKNEN